MKKKYQPKEIEDNSKSTITILFKELADFLAICKKYSQIVQAKIVTVLEGLTKVRKVVITADKQFLMEIGYEA